MICKNLHICTNNSKKRELTWSSSPLKSHHPLTTCLLRPPCVWWLVSASWLLESPSSWLVLAGSWLSRRWVRRREERLHTSTIVLATIRHRHHTIVMH